MSTRILTPASIAPMALIALGVLIAISALIGLSAMSGCAQPSITPAPEAQTVPIETLVGNLSRSAGVFTQQGGETIYRAVCQACHMDQGQGARGAGFYPALAGDARLASPLYPVVVVLNGLHGMPGFGSRLNDRQVADVVNFVRTSFGNGYPDAVTPADVQQQRSSRR